MQTNLSQIVQEMRNRSEGLLIQSRIAQADAEAAAENSAALLVLSQEAAETADAIATLVVAQAMQVSTSKVAALTSLSIPKGQS